MTPKNDNNQYDMMSNNSLIGLKIHSAGRKSCLIQADQVIFMNMP